MEQYTDKELQRAIDRVKSKVFLDSTGGFLGSILCSLEFQWANDIPTACVSPDVIKFNPDWFMELPEPTRIFVMLHELWHVAYLHFVRVGNRDPEYWNYACDISINNRLVADGYTHKGTDPWIDPSMPRDMPSEDIYDIIYKNKKTIPPTGAWGNASGTSGDMTPVGNSGGDMMDATSEQKAKLVNSVVRAIHNSNINAAGNIPGEIIETVDKFLKPQLPWHVIVRNWLTELAETRTSWRRPNRRYTDMYMPSRIKEDGRLTHLIYYQDASGSITDKEKQVFNSELKHVWDELKPIKMTIVIFDTKIQQEIVFNDGDQFNDIKIRGGGGTSLTLVRKHIMDNNPTAAIIFSDMWVTPMEKGPKCPIVWVCVNNESAQVEFGKLIHLKC